MQFAQCCVAVHALTRSLTIPGTRVVEDNASLVSSSASEIVVDCLSLLRHPSPRGASCICLLARTLDLQISFAKQIATYDHVVL